MPDSNPDSDITVLTVNSDEISNFGDDSGESGIGGEHEDLQAKWSQKFWGINIDEFDTPSGPQLPDGIDVATATPIKYFDLLFPERIFEVLKNNMNCYAEFHCNQNLIAIREGLTKEIPIMKTLNGMRPVTDEMQALFGVMIIMGIQYLPQDKIYTGTKMSLLETVA